MQMHIEISLCHYNKIMHLLSIYEYYKYKYCVVDKMLHCISM